MSDSKVVPLFSDVVPNEARIPNAEIVGLLETLLAKARSGEVQGLAAAYVNADGTVGDTVEGAGDRFAMSHAISGLWFRYQMNMFDNAEPSS